MTAAVVIALSLAAQVPPPDAATKAGEALRARERAALDAEAASLRALADRLTREGRTDAAAEVRRALPPPPPASGASRFRPLPEVVRRVGPGLANVPAGSDRWRAELAEARAGTARALWDLADRAATSEPKHYALADACLRGVLDRQPDHSGARRLLGYLPHEGGWATPYAVRQLADGQVLHPTYGWVKASWLPHLERGELPAPTGPGQKAERWLPAAEADALRRDWARGWTIETEHFRIRTNVPLSEAIEFGRKLDVFHGLFFSALADVFGERLPLARRFREKAPGREPSPPPRHLVHYYAERAEFVDAVRPFQGPAAERCLGLYIPPPPGKGGKGRRAPAYFFRDPGGDLDVSATLYHEVSHQLLFETGSAGLSDYTRNAGNFWVFEGMGTYFESLVTRPDGTVEVGGWVGRRIEAARESLVVKRAMVPLAGFVRLDQDRFNDEEAVYLHYQQADALATLLMDGRGGADRDDFLDYFRDAYHGRLGRATGRALWDRLGRGPAEVSAELLDRLARVPAGR